MIVIYGMFLVYMVFVFLYVARSYSVMTATLNTLGSLMIAGYFITITESVYRPALFHVVVSTGLMSIPVFMAMFEALAKLATPHKPKGKSS